MISIPKKEFVKEHRHLIKLLSSFNEPSAKAEAKSQAKELKTIVGSGDLSKTDYVDVYPSDVLRVLELMTFDDGLLLVGSSAIRSQLYAGDVDGFEVVERHDASDATALTQLRKQFQSMIAKLKKTRDIFITDIKSGAIAEWEIINPEAHIKGNKVVGLNFKQVHSKIDELLDKKILTSSEATQARGLLKRRPKVADFLRAKDELKYHTIRWSELEIAQNKKVLRDGRTVTLEDTFSMPAVTKLDCVSLVQRSRYTDFSVIYEFKNKGKTLNPTAIDPKTKIAEDVEAYKARGNFFKALKRQFSLARLKDDGKAIERLTEILNSDLGILYNIVSDIGTLQSILTLAPIDKVKYEIDQFKARLANVWETQAYLKAEPDIVKDIQALMKAPRPRMNALLERLGNRLDAILQSEAKKHI
jgi:hypothetical protein